jgi:sugar (pentulose or hexulose) kinase
MEGICFAERQVLELSQDLNDSPRGEVVLSGRAGNDPHWLATRLRTMGQSLRIVDDREITCRGSAILADAMLSQDLATSTTTLMVSGKVHHPTAQDIDYSQRQFNRFLARQKALLLSYEE